MVDSRGSPSSEESQYPESESEGDERVLPQATDERPADNDSSMSKPSDERSNRHQVLDRRVEESIRRPSGEEEGQGKDTCELESDNCDADGELNEEADGLKGDAEECQCVAKDGLAEDSEYQDVDDGAAELRSMSVDGGGGERQ